jgi:hypothetical protein
MSDDTLRGQFHSAAAAPSEPLDWPQTLERGLRRRRRRRAVPAVLTGAVVVAAAIAVPLAVAARAPAGQVLHGTPTAPSWEGQASPALHVPSGWRAVTYGDVQIAVPAGWQVVDAAGRSCGATAGTPAVVLGTPPAGGLPCPATTRYLVWARPAPANTRTGAAVSVDGLSIATVASTTSVLVQGAQVTYLVRAFGVELTVASAWARSVIATVSPSARYVVARPGLLPYTPSQWRQVGLDGVSLRVPPTWPVVTRGPVLCDELTPWTSSEANIGPRLNVRSCGTPAGQRLVAGAWLFASNGKPPASWGVVVGDFQVRGGTVQVFAGDPAATWVPVLVTPSGHGTPVGLWLGVGSDGVIARDILASIEVTAQ